jgi:hypothetical protein
MIDVCVYVCVCVCGKCERLAGRSTRPRVRRIKRARLRKWTDRFLDHVCVCVCVCVCMCVCGNC